MFWPTAKRLSWVEKADEALTLHRLAFNGVTPLHYMRRTIPHQERSYPYTVPVCERHAIQSIETPVVLKSDHKYIFPIRYEGGSKEGQQGVLIISAKVVDQVAPELADVSHRPAPVMTAEGFNNDWITPATV